MSTPTTFASEQDLRTASLGRLYLAAVYLDIKDVCSFEREVLVEEMLRRLQGITPEPVSTNAESTQHGDEENGEKGNAEESSGQKVDSQEVGREEDSGTAGTHSGEASGKSDAVLTADDPKVARRTIGPQRGKKAEGTSATAEPVVRQHGITRPAGGKTGAIWDIADAISRDKRRPAEREEVVGMCERQGFSAATAATQYSKWRTFFGLPSERGKIKNKRIRVEAAEMDAAIVTADV